MHTPRAACCCAELGTRIDPNSDKCQKRTEQVVAELDRSGRRAHSKLRNRCAVAQSAASAHEPAGLELVLGLHFVFLEEPAHRWNAAQEFDEALNQYRLEDIARHDQLTHCPGQDDHFRRVWPALL